MNGVGRKYGGIVNPDPGAAPYGFEESSPIPPHRRIARLPKHTRGGVDRLPPNPTSTNEGRSSATSSVRSSGTGDKGVLAMVAPSRFTENPKCRHAHVAGWSEIDPDSLTSCMASFGRED